MNNSASLYERLGGYDAIAAVANHLLPCLMADGELGRFWKHRGRGWHPAGKAAAHRLLMSSCRRPRLLHGPQHDFVSSRNADFRIRLGSLHGARQ